MRAAAVKPALQARSRATEQRLFDAAAKLFTERGLEGTGIADIVAHARTGIGTFYGRFRDKNAFVEAFCRRYFEAGGARARTVLAEDRLPARSIAEFASAYVRYRIDHYQRDRHLLLAVVTHLRRSGTPELRRLAAAFAAEFRDLIVDRLRAQPDAGKDIRARDVAVALTLVEAVLKDLYLAGGGGLVSPPLSRQELHARLTALFIDALRRRRGRS